MGAHVESHTFRCFVVVSSIQQHGFVREIEATRSASFNFSDTNNVVFALVDLGLEFGEAGLRA